MPTQISLVVPADEMVPIEELYELTGIDSITPLVDENDEVHELQLVWDDVTLIATTPTLDEMAERIQDFVQQVDHALAGRNDKKAGKMKRRAARMVRVIDCIVTPDWDPDRKAQLAVQGLMEHYDYAYMLADGAIYNENGNIELGPENADRKYWAIEEVEEELASDAIRRKERSLVRLKEEKIPFIEHLPPIASEEETTLRDQETVVRRAIALNLISRRAEGESYDWFHAQVERYRLQDDVTDDEWEFAADDEPPQYVVIKFSRRMESYWCLLWSLGMIRNRLGKPDNFANVERANEIIATRSLDQFLLDATLQDKKEILDEADLHYRYHWAVIDAELYGRKPPRSLKPDVVYERHYALNWLIRYQNLEWDDVTTDT